MNVILPEVDLIWYTERDIREGVLYQYAEGTDYSDILLGLSTGALLSLRAGKIQDGSFRIRLTALPIGTVVQLVQEEQ